VSKIGNVVDNIEEKQYVKKNSTQMQVLYASFSEFILKTAFVYLRETPTQDQIKILKKDFQNVDLVMGDIVRL
jgi:hypothetical protein